MNIYRPNLPTMGITMSLLMSLISRFPLYKFHACFVIFHVKVKKALFITKKRKPFRKGLDIGDIMFIDTFIEEFID